MYQFPEIFTIDDVLPFIKGFDEIVVADKGDYTWIDYVVDTGETFSNKHQGWEMRRECRGLLFDNRGFIVSRPFHKFFNVNQLEETQANLIDMGRDHKIMVKEDGSMVRPFWLDGHAVRWATRKGESDTINFLRKDFPDMFGEDSYDCHSQRYQQMFFQLQNNYTPIYEYVGPNNKHVVSYDKPRLILLAVRDNHSGQYFNIHDKEMFMYANDVVDVLESPNNIEEFMETIRVLKGSEGAVITFGNEYYKVKAEDYVLKHRARDAVAKKRHIWTMILDGTLDDFIPLLNDADKAIVDETEKEFWKLFYAARDGVEEFAIDCVNKYGNKKDFAMTKDQIDPVLKQFVFAKFDQKDHVLIFENHIRKHLNQDSKQAELQQWMESFL